MNKKLTMLLSAVFLPLLMLAQGWPAEYGGVMMQGFYWDSYKPKNAMLYIWGHDSDGYEWATRRTTWSEMTANVNLYAPYFDIIWVPQSGRTNGWGNDRMGFMPVWWFDHNSHNRETNSYNYELNSPDGYNQSAYPYIFGTQDELVNMIRTYNNAGTTIMEDVVINHKGYVDDDFNNLWPWEIWNSTTNSYEIQWSLADLIANDGGTGATEPGEQTGQWGPDLDHSSANVQYNTKRYLDFLKNTLGYKGFRYDFAKGFDTKYFTLYTLSARPTFSVGEVWDQNLDVVRNWIKGVYGEGELQSAAFDFPLKYCINKAFQVEKYDSDNWSLMGRHKDEIAGSGVTGRQWFLLDGTSLIHDWRMKRYAVTFVDNHDSFKNLSTDQTNYKDRLDYNIPDANAFILMMPGTPCVFYPHFERAEWHDAIVQAIKIRHAAGITNTSSLSGATKFGTQTAQQGIAWTVTGTKGKVYIYCGDNNTAENVIASVPSGYTEVWSGNVTRIWADATTKANLDAIVNDSQIKEPQANGYPVVSLPSGSYTGAQRVTLSPSTGECVLVYTTDGSEPTTSSNRATGSGVTLNLQQTTTVKAAVLNGGKVIPGSTKTFAYVINSMSSTNSDITIFVHSTASNPKIYVWHDGGQLNGNWPGDGWTGTMRVGGITWQYFKVSRNTASSLNFILSDGGNNQTADVTGVTRDVFYTFTDGIAFDLTAQYIGALRYPTVSIDKQSGEYASPLTVTLTPSCDNATVVYTTDGSDPATSATRLQSTGAVTLTRSGEGIDLPVRAAILSEGKAINAVARSYRTSGGAGTAQWVSESVPSTGINLYVSADEAPVIFTWNADGSPDGDWPGSQIGDNEVRRVGGKTWYYRHYDLTSLNFIYSKHGSDATAAQETQTEDLKATTEGSYFFTYNPSADKSARAVDVSVSGGYVTATESTIQPASDGKIVVLVRNMNNSLTPYIHYWGTGNDSSQPVEMTDYVEIDGNKWYYKRFDTLSGVLFATDADWHNKTSDMSTGDPAYLTFTAGNYHFFEYYPEGDGWKCDPSHDYTSSLPGSPASRTTLFASQERPVSDGSAVSTATLPSCAAALDGLYVYFENGTYTAPHIYTYGSEKGYTGSGWPGQAMVDRVGTAPNGNAIYRWHYNGTVDNNDLPAGIIFNDNGVRQTADLAFVNGGYYTVDGLVGTVVDNVAPMTGLLTRTDRSEPVVLGEDITCVGVGVNGDRLFVKDANGSCLNPTVNSGNLPMVEVQHGAKTFVDATDYDQSNWMVLTLPAGVTLDEEARLNLTGHTLLAHTVAGLLTGEGSMQLSAMPLSGTESDYELNAYLPANFVEQSQYFAMPPKANELCVVTNAVYRDGAFYMADDDNSLNAEGLSGGVALSTHSGMGGLSTADFENGNAYQVTGVVLAAGPSSAGMPHRVEAKTGQLSDDYELAALSAQTLVVTGIDRVDTEARPVGVTYYNLLGIGSTTPHEGLNVVVTRYSDGSTRTTKVIR